MKTQRKELGKQTGLACMLLIALSCGMDPAGEGKEQPTAEVSVEISADGYSTKSSFDWSEEWIHDLQVFITEDNGDVCEIIYGSKTSGLSFTGTVGRHYQVWAAANLGKRVEVVNISEFSSSPLTVSSAEIAAGGIPMFSPEPAGVTIREKGGKVEVRLTRMMARIDLGIGLDGLEYPDEFTVNSVQLYNATGAYLPFEGTASRKGGENGGSFDSASESDLEALNTGDTASLYAFENMQGTLLPGNKDPWSKIPSNIGNASERCSYLEISCSYSTPKRTCDDITYRLYLGSDNTSNFDVRRNTVYKISLKPSEEEIYGERGSWKIESRDWTEIQNDKDIVYAELRVTPEDLEIKAGEIATVTSYLYITYRDGTSKRIPARSRWRTTMESVVWNADSTGALNLDKVISTLWIKGIAPGYATIHVSYEYEGVLYKTECHVTVIEDPDDTTDETDEQDAV